MSIHANNPIKNASVSASAGTGKTWLLVSRIIKLLLSGVKPDTILAITFTRKAAAEMYSRLSERLLILASCDDKRLLEEIRLIECTPTPEILNTARRLYEKLLHRVQSVKTTTFHAFCSDLLTRFPLEADIPPAFGLAEQTNDLQSAAWDALLNETTQNPDDDIARSLELLFESCNGIFNTHAALSGFLNHRSDWWAYTEGQSNAVDYACQTLLNKLQLTTLDSPIPGFFTPALTDTINEFVNLLAKHPIKTNLEHKQTLEKCQKNTATKAYEQAFDNLHGVFFTQGGSPRKRKESNTQKKKMGDEGEQRFLLIHDSLCENISSIKAQNLTIKTFKINRAWYQTGQRLLHYYQLLKSEQRILDFSDLEWKAYQLLNHSDNSNWIQYKLDERIDHLLIDEFQDTNPTQWQLVKPLLDEMENTEYPGQRSIFLVGDKKQSIYRFRRADPELFEQAQQLLQTRLHAENIPLDTSWRSSPAIINFINQVFTHSDICAVIPDFPKHATHLNTLWGYVELLPLAANSEGDADMATDNLSHATHHQLRNPLHTPRLVKEDDRHNNEAKNVAEKISELIVAQTAIEKSGLVRALKYSDIIILLRSRTHAGSYEQALRDAKIPYIGAGRGTLLESQEIKDLIALLQVLSAPFNNLSLATILRSPVFACSDADLMLLAKPNQGTWRERLSDIATNTNENTRLHYADGMLNKWSTYVDLVPVHDLLDRIYFQGNILRRYESAYPEHLQSRVKANLGEFLALSLELDSGRYPSLGKFLVRFDNVELGESEQFDEATAETGLSKVRLMTIHAAKGLEAPVIFLVDATNIPRPPKSYQALISWPSHSRTPTDFILVGKKENQDAYTANIIQSNASSELRENYNLLYVAATRAKQLLFISGSMPRNSDKLGWYGTIEQQYDVSGKLEQFGSPPPLSTLPNPILQKQSKKDADKLVINNNLTHPIRLMPKPKEIKPSEMVDEKSNAKIIAALKKQNTPSEMPAESLKPGIIGEVSAGIRGQVIHRILQLLCENTAITTINPLILNEYNIDLNTPIYTNWHQEATATFKHESTQAIFNPRYYEKAFNEVPIYYQQKGHPVYGIIDRLVLTQDEIIIVDYKTHTNTEDNIQNLLLEHYRNQLEYYSAGAKKLWPDKTVSPMILFTHNINLIRV